MAESGAPVLPRRPLRRAGRSRHDAGVGDGVSIQLRGPGGGGLKSDYAEQAEFAAREHISFPLLGDEGLPLAWLRGQAAGAGEKR
ncbi:MAG: hypothetical protein JSU06_07350 [Actinobacteria bacterium]|nr:hypothetical protein [Actinomycetota bacterium]